MSTKRAKGERPPDVEFGIDWAAKAANLCLHGGILGQHCNKPIEFISTIQRHQYCAYHNVGNGAFYHRRERIKTFWPEYEMHRWFDRRLQADSYCNWLTQIGPASSGKSADGAICDLEWWMQAPHETAVILCSTTMKMLRKRIWAEVVRWHQKLDPKLLGPVGELMDSATTIRWQQGDDRHAIFGLAVEEGNIEEVLNNLVGIKAKRVRLRIDEGQGIREAILRATNNMAKNPIFQFRMMGNPESLQNPLMRESEPIDGWDSTVRAETPEWKTRGGPVAGDGICQFFDGRNSPADDSPEERRRLPFLINKDQIAYHLKSVKGNINDPTYWSQSIGWPPPQGLESTLLDDAIITTFKCKEKAVWTEGYIACAFLDPARTGGDKRILQFGRRGRSSGVGYNDEARTWSTSVGQTSWIVEGTDFVNVPINAEDRTRPIDYQIVDFVKVECIKRGIPPDEFSLFSTGAGGPLLSIFRAEWSPMVNGLEEGGSPSDRVLDDTGKTAKEAYDNRSSELQFNVREFAVANGIRGLSNEAAFEFASRRTFYRNGKWCIEPKVGGKGRTDEKGRSLKGFKERLGFSPDHGDAFAGLVAHCMERGALPNLSGQATTEEQQLPPDLYDEYSSENYLRAPSFAA
jgi:hypothetical protein